MPTVIPSLVTAPYSCLAILRPPLPTLVEEPLGVCNSPKTSGLPQLRPASRCRCRMLAPQAQMLLFTAQPQPSSLLMRS
jgi:hypothetical protein